jgi:hypothetical protein
VTPRAPLRPCSSTRCKRRVFDAVIIKARGAPVDVVLDGQPSTWADGARFRLLVSDHLPDGQQNAEKLTAAQIHRAFAAQHLYVEHAEMCQAEQRKKKAKKADGSHA